MTSFPSTEKKLPPLRLFNTLSREKEEIRPLEGKKIKMYTCGPTVYDYAHIGNFRTYIFEDLLRKTLKWFGYQVTQVMNITDIDDKTLKGAIAKGVSLKEYTTPYTKAFFEDLDALGIEKAEKYPAATEYIPEMIEMIQKLLDKGIAYQGQDGSIYYAIRKFPRYGCLSHFKLDELKEGASERVSADEYDKENASDFVLWKAYDPKRDGKIFWESPFGQGRPGWHLECSAMAIKLLGETLDIHCGGVDNMFPHHENEIAQSEACSGKTFAKIWMHSEHLLVDQKKMSKSLGNFYTFRQLLEKGYAPKTIRYMLLQTHYKTQLNFTLPGLKGAENSLDRLNSCIARLQDAEKTGKDTKENSELTAFLDTAYAKFSEGLADDLNISVSLAALFDVVRELNTLLDQETFSKKEAKEALSLLQIFNQVLGVLDFSSSDETPQELVHLLEERQKARKEKNWAQADLLRDQIHEAGYRIEDTPHGCRLKKE